MALIYLYDSHIKDFTYNGQPLQKVYDVVVKHFLNDEYYVTWKHAIDKEDVYKNIQKDKIITAHTPTGMQPFRIMDPVKTMDYVEFEAWPLLFADMRNKLIRPLSLKNASGQQAIDAFVTNLLLDTPFEFTTNITERHDYHTQSEDERESNPNQLYDALEVFKALVNRWNAELIINGYDIRLVDRVGEEKQALLYEKKNITSYIDRESISGIVTRVYGKSEWTESTDGGDSIDHSIQTSVDSPLIDSYNGIIFEKQYTNNDIRSEQELIDWLNLKFATENIDKPSRNIELDTNIIQSEEVHLGDGLVLKYLKHDADMRIRMIGYDYDGYADRYIKTYLGDAKDTFTGSVSNTVVNVESTAKKQSEQIAHVILNRQGVKVIYSPVEPTGDFRNNDIWFDEEGGMFKYDSEVANWIPHPYNRRMDIAQQAIEEQQQDIQDAKESADAANQQINDSIQNAGFTSLNDLTTNLRSISESAQLDATDSLSNSVDALSTAQSALSGLTDVQSSISNIEIDINDIEGTLALKATQTDLNSLTGFVDQHTLDIQANAQGLTVKADSSTVDTLSETVESLSTEVGLVAGELSSKISQTQLTSAVDNIEIGGRNRFSLVNFESEKFTNSTYPSLVSWVYTGEPDTEYTLSTDIDGSGYDLFLYNVGGSPSSASNGVKRGEPRNIVSDSDGKVELAFRNASSMAIGWEDVLSGEYHVQLERGNKVTDWKVAQEDTTELISHIQSEWTQTFNSFQSTVSDIDGNVSDLQQTINGLQSTVYDADTGLSSLNTQLANLIQVAVTGDELSNSLSVTETNILAQTVKNGEVVAQINQEAGRTLIQNDQLLLDVNTVVFGGSAFIPDASISSLSADKLTAGTIDANEINVININANSIVSNRTEFVRSAWNGINGSLSADSSGLLTQSGDLSTTINAGEITTISGAKTGKVNALGMQIYDSDNGQTTRLHSDGLEFKWYDIIRHISQTSEGLRIIPSTGSGARLNSSLDLRTGPGNDKVAYLQLSIPDASSNARLQLAGNVLSLRHPNGGQLSVSNYAFDEAQGLIRSGTFRTSPYDGQYLEMVGRVIQTPRTGNQNIYIMPNGTGGVTIGSGGSARWPITALRFIEDSNRASKTNIETYTGTGLDVIKDLKVVTYNRRVDLERGINQKDIGFIAEDSPAISIQQPNGPLGVDNYHTVAYAVKAIQELASDADNLLKVASHAYLLAEQHEDELACYKKKIEELEAKVKRLEGAA